MRDSTLQAWRWLPLEHGARARWKLQSIGLTRTALRRGPVLRDSTLQAWRARALALPHFHAVAEGTLL